MKKKFFSILFIGIILLAFVNINKISKIEGVQDINLFALQKANADMVECTELSRYYCDPVCTLRGDCCYCPYGSLCCSEM